MRKLFTAICLSLLLSVSLFAQELSISASTPDGTVFKGKTFNISYAFSYSGPDVPSETHLVVYQDGAVWFTGSIFGYVTPFTMDPCYVPIYADQLSKGLHQFWFVVYNGLETENSNVVTIEKRK